ncbi:hypothetical protein GQR58_004662 [Nymphon striatum]|nr:hypothetical protein GQR58_004662 [Nymphon striatum]
MSYALPFNSRIYLLISAISPQASAFNSVFRLNGTMFTIRPMVEIPMPSTKPQYLKGLFRFTFPTIRKILISPQMMRFRRDTSGLNSVGIAGAQCLSRLICETSSTPQHHEGLIGDILDMLIMIVPENKERRRDYWDAHSHGLMNGNCQQQYKGCPISIYSMVGAS